jgi:SAM-dependent methyltransferase
MNIDYNHAQNTHTLEGARTALAVLLSMIRPGSMLDVGCGTGVWLLAASELGVSDFVGIDGVDIPERELHIPSHHFVQRNLEFGFDLGRRFDLALCLEVAEHLDCSSSRDLVKSITRSGKNFLTSTNSPAMTQFGGLSGQTLASRHGTDRTCSLRGGLQALRGRSQGFRASSTLSCYCTWTALSRCAPGLRSSSRSRTDACRPGGIFRSRSKARSEKLEDCCNTAPEIPVRL